MNDSADTRNQDQEEKFACYTCWVEHPVSEKKTCPVCSEAICRNCWDKIAREQLEKR